MKKKLVTGALLAAFGAVAVTGGTLAYFTDADQKDNTFTVGNVDILLTEPNWTASGSQDAPEVYPGEALKKDPTITNNGKNPCFVRVKVEGLDSLNKVGASDIVYRTNYVDGALGSEWEYGDDGYFYYTEVLPVYDGSTNNHVTTPLFDQIVIPTDLENGVDGNSYSVVVKAEAVQAQGAKPSFAAVQEMELEDIKAWFGTCMADAGVEEQA